MVDQLKLYNTQGRKSESPPQGKIGLYVCGITPYDATHLGHVFTFITYDVLVRYLRFLGRKVSYVQNVTDIDDDILLRAKATGQNWRQLGDTETKKFLEDMANLNMLKFDHYVRATDHIAEIILIIKRLLSKDYAYVSGNNVYFSVVKDGEFGQRLVKLNYDAMLDIANERGNFPTDPNKKDPLDFVLWQSQKPGEPYWDSPWGRGRPGWHIECSAMSIKYLGQPVTLHGGGADLKFPHHEAEISQSEKAHDKPFVSHWLHVAMVYCEGKKMSKSLGNMIFVRDLLKKYSVNAIRWYLLSHHYRKEWNYDEEEFKKVAKEVENFAKMKDFKSPKDIEEEPATKDFFQAMNNDLDTPTALKQLFKLRRKNPTLAKTLAREIFGLKF